MQSKKDKIDKLKQEINNLKWEIELYKLKETNFLVKITGGVCKVISNPFYLFGYDKQYVRLKFTENSFSPGLICEMWEVGKWNYE